MKIKETKNDNIQITMTREEAMELRDFLCDTQATCDSSLAVWDLLYSNEHLL